MNQLIQLIRREDMCKFNVEVNVENTKYKCDGDNNNQKNNLFQNKRLA